MKQQSKADTSHKLESNPDACVSTAQNRPSGKPREPHDDQSHTGSSEHRRKTREHPDPIPISSDKGKGAMYSGKDKYRNPSPPRNQHAPPRPRQRSPAGNVRPHGPGGINIRNDAEPRRSRNNERTPEPRKSRNDDRAPEPKQTQRDGGSHRNGGGSHRSRSQHRQDDRGEHESGSKRHNKPPHGSPSPPPSKGGGGGGRRSRSRSESPGHRRNSRDAQERLNEYNISYIGPKSFWKRIREEATPKGLSLKLPRNLKHYDGKERPDTWIDDYFNAVNFAGGTPNMACRML
jgi:hypothetical protein